MRLLNETAVKATLLSACLFGTAVQGHISSGGSSTATAFLTSNGVGASTLITSTTSPQSSNTETVYVSPVVTGKGSQSTDPSSSSTKASATGAGVTSDKSSTTPALSTNLATSTSSVVLSSSSSSPSSTTSSTLSTTLAQSSTSAEQSTTAPVSTTSLASSSTSSSAEATATGSSSGSATKKSGTCTDEGEFNCVASNYQQCASGAWTAMQALPAGTTCQQGLSEGLWARASPRGEGLEKVRKVRRTRNGRFSK